MALQIFLDIATWAALGAMLVLGVVAFFKTKRERQRRLKQFSRLADQLGLDTMDDVSAAGMVGTVPVVLEIPRRLLPSIDGPYWIASTAWFGLASLGGLLFMAGWEPALHARDPVAFAVGSGLWITLVWRQLNPDAPRATGTVLTGLPEHATIRPARSSAARGNRDAHGLGDPSLDDVVHMTGDPLGLLLRLDAPSREAVKLHTGAGHTIRQGKATMVVTVDHAAAADAVDAFARRLEPLIEHRSHPVSDQLVERFATEPHPAVRWRLLEAVLQHVDPARVEDLLPPGEHETDIDPDATRDVVLARLWRANRRGEIPDPRVLARIDAPPQTMLRKLRDGLMVRAREQAGDQLAGGVSLVEGGHGLAGALSSCSDTRGELSKVPARSDDRPRPDRGAGKPDAIG